jgi:hypothetical protein
MLDWCDLYAKFECRGCHERSFRKVGFDEWTGCKKPTARTESSIGEALGIEAVLLVKYLEASGNVVGTRTNERLFVEEHKWS